VNCRVNIGRRLSTPPSQSGFNDPKRRRATCPPANHPETIDAPDWRDYSDYMITNLREAKSKLSQLVQLAAQGEEIVITVRGRPAARLTGIVPQEAGEATRTEWANELAAAADAARVGPPTSTSQKFWDALREERL